MADTTQILRQAPYLEDIQKKILELGLARGEEPLTLPPYQVAPLDPLTSQAITAGQAGIGAFRPYMEEAQSALGAGAGILGAAQPAVTDYLTEAGATGRGAMGAFAPTAETIQPFMDPYTQLSTQAALDELGRQKDIEATKVRAGQVGTTALGGDRGALQLSELSRNVLDIGSRRTFEDFSRNYNQALNAAQGAFENQQNRQQGVAGLLGQLGQVTGQESARLASGLGQFGLSQANIGGLEQTLGGRDVQLLSQLGGVGQAQSQRELDAIRRSEIQQQTEPFSRIGWLSDIFKPSIKSAMTELTSVAPDAPASALSQGLAAGIAGLGINKALDNPFGPFLKSAVG